MRRVREVVITGCGAVSPFGLDAEALWTAILQGRKVFEAHAVQEPDLPEIEPMFAAVIHDFPAKEILGRRGLRAINYESQLFVAAAMDARKSSELKDDDYAPPDCGVFVGVERTGLDDYVKFHVEKLVWGMSKVSPTRGPNTGFNAPASHAAIRLNLQGPNLTFSSRRSSSLDAIAHAADWIRSGRADLMFAGGVDSFSYPFARHLQAVGHESSSQPRPFDGQRNGWTPGEGAVVLTLESRESASKRAAPILASIGAWKAAFDHKNPAAALQRCIENQEARLVFASANGDRVGDALEATAITASLSSATVCAIKGCTGEWDGASGALQTLAAVKSLQTKIIPTTLGFETVDEAFCDLSISTGQVHHQHNRALVTSLNQSGRASMLALQRL